MGTKRTEKSGLEAFIRIHKSHSTVEEAAAALGIDVLKYKKRLSVYNVTLKKNGYEPLQYHGKKTTRTAVALSKLEADGLIQRQPKRDAHGRAMEDAIERIKNKKEKREQPLLWEND